MNVRIVHDGTDISSHVIRYDREHKICTGIGMLELEVDYTYGSSFNPWDKISIYEDGSKAAEYYVSIVSEGQPSATVVVTAQDKSKRLTDYFITDYYLVDYPSYTKYWIELFLTEVGISYTFTVNGNGSLLSNNTSLGLMSAYEQIIQLLQLSGWYITFDSGGKAIIGRLTSGGSTRGTFGTHDITEIKVDKNDKMYRNRVVVWGHGDPATNRWVFADVSKPTKWDYDAKDKRTILISNTNVPTVSAAFMLANQCLAEFARLNIEKYLTVTGTRGVMVGNVVGVKTKVFTGRGLITTLGVSMSESGLVTNLALDERCPRLFGFFDFGGWVYVGTFGDGVWRKHILSYSGSDPSGIVLSGFASGVVPSGWFNYSSGLMDLNITDLHINNGVLASVASSGTIYYSLEDETTFSGTPMSGQMWSGIPMSGFQIIYSGTMVDPTVYSGLMGRACIIDRDTNFLHYAIDTRSGINYGDFLMETDPLGGLFQSNLGYLYPSGIGASGVYSSGMLVMDNRSWIYEVNPFDGSGEMNYPVYLSGIPFSGIVHSSGSTFSGVASGVYNFSIYDIENDGTHDYADVMTTLSGSIPATLFNSQFRGNLLHDPNDYYIYENLPYGVGFKAAMSYSGYPVPIEQTFDMDDAGARLGATWDYTPISDAYHATSRLSSFGYQQLHVYKSTIDENGNLTTVNNNFITTLGYYTNTVLGIDRDNTLVYNFYINTTVGTNELRKVAYNILTDTITESSTFDLPTRNDTMVIPRLGGNIRSFARLTMGTTMYTARAVSNGSGFDLLLAVTDLRTGSTTERTVLTKTGTGSGVGQYEYVTPYPVIQPYGTDNFTVSCLYIERTNLADDLRSMKFYFARALGFSSFTDTMILDHSAEHGNYSVFDPNYETIDITSGDRKNFNLNDSYLVFTMATGQLTFLNGNFFEETDGALSSVFSMVYDRVGYINNSNGQAIVRRRSDSVFVYINPYTMTVISEIPHPTGYTLEFFCGIDSINGELFFKAKKGILVPRKIISINSYGNITRVSNAADSNFPETLVGNYRVAARVYFVSPGKIYGYYPLYLVLQRDGWDYNIVKSGYYQERLDISNYSPLITMGRGISTMETFFITTDNAVTRTSFVGISGYNLGDTQASGSMFSLGINADDFRYSNFGDVLESGNSTQLFIAYSGGLGNLGIMGSGSFSGVMLSPSGYINRLEISNYSFPDQYMFVSVSGYTNGSGEWGFYQKSPTASGTTLSGVTLSGFDVSEIYSSMSGMFIDCSSGYPQSRTTIIRLDDRL
jgi:hypothetical protein